MVDREIVVEYRGRAIPAFLYPYLIVITAKENIPCARAEEEEIFSCMICKNKAPTQFVNVVSLKSHLFDAHFSRPVKDAIEKDLTSL